LPSLKINSSVNNLFALGSSGDFVREMVNQNYNPVDLNIAQGSTQLTRVVLTPKRKGSVTKPPSLSANAFISY